MALEAGKSVKELSVRAFQVLGFAGVIDVFIWRILPVYVMDVLYVIAFGMMLLLRIRNLKTSLQWAIAFGLIGGSFVWQQYYHFNIHTVGLRLTDFKVMEMLRHIFLDGWFPILPWSGFAVLGYVTYASKAALQNNTKWFLFLGSALLLSYFVAAATVLDFAPLRKEYTEVFYPVTWSFLVYAFGLFALVISGYFYNLTNFRFVSALGRISLTIYFIHFVIIGYLIPEFLVEKEVFNSWISLVIIVVFYVLILVLAKVILNHLQELKRGKLKMLGKGLGL
jgi:hypothetical protein